VASVPFNGAFLPASLFFNPWIVVPNALWREAELRFPVNITKGAQ
jgi:hypothetical protein